MRLSTKAHYGLKAMFDLALCYGVEEPVPLKVIAERQNISDNYLEQLMSVLRRAGLVKSMRGAHGGYVLARNPDFVSIGDIVRTLEGSIAPIDCVCEHHPVSCDEADHCMSRIVWLKLRDKISDVFDSISLGDMCREATQLRNLNNHMNQV